MRNSLFMVLCILCTVLSISAAPMNGTAFNFKQPDGSRVPVRVFGDEFYQSVETPDGHTLVRDSEGWISYAELSREGGLIATDKRYSANSRYSGTLHLREAGHIQRQKRNEMRQMLQLPSIEEERATFAKRTPLDPSRATDTIIGLTVLIDFPDKKSDVGRDEIERMINQEGYSNFGNNGSLRDFYWDASAGKLVYLNFITQFYTAKYDKGYYDTAGGWGKASELITESLNWLKTQGFDFSQITGQNGSFQCLNFYYAGVPDHGWSKGLWPHFSTYQGNFSAAGLSARKYQFTNIGAQLDNYTFIHENGHMLCGYPDLYSYETGHNGGLNGMCAMASNMPNNPVMFNPYFRDLMGWMDVTPLSSANEGKVFKDVANDETCYTWGSGSEMFYIENRAKKGRSAKLAGEGLMIWHVNENGSNTKKSSYGLLVALEQADGQKTLEGGGWGNETDWFYQGNNDRFNDNTTPNAKYQSGSASGLDVANISAIGDEMSFSIGEINGNQDEITLKTPEAGDSYSVGQTVAITWEDNFDGDVTIALVGGSNSDISTGTASDGAYDWEIPASITPGDYKIKIASKDDASVSDLSGIFTIVETIDTTNPTELIPIAGWTSSGDQDGSTVSMDTTKKSSENLITGSFNLIKSNDAEEIYPWAKLSAWTNPGNLEGVTALKITYKSTGKVQLFLEDITLSVDGKNYEHELAASSSITTVLLTPAMFKQPSWLADSQKTPLNLAMVDGLSFGSTVSEASAEFELKAVTLYNFAGIPDAVTSGAVPVSSERLLVKQDGLQLSVGATPVSVSIATVNGREVLHTNFTAAGVHTLSFSEMNLASGIYFYRIEESTRAVHTGTFLHR